MSGWKIEGRKADVVWAWVKEHGIPQALYTDWKNVYVREPTAQEVMRGEEPPTQFGRMCQKLGTKIVAACSPQAKGRVERNHGIHQDRLIKKMRRKTIGDFERANRYLEQEYLRQHNARFTVGPAQAADFHRRVDAGVDGTNNPQARLEVSGSVTVSGGGVINGNGSGLTNVNAALLNGLASTAFAPATGSAAYVAKGGDTTSGALNVPANGLNVGLSQLAFSSGRIGIGTTTPGTHGGRMDQGSGNRPSESEIPPPGRTGACR